MELRILGCHGGETPKHRTSSFLLDERVAIDAGAVTSMLTLEEQHRIETVLVSHAHLGHGAPTYHARSEHIHVHLVCSQCGDVKGVDAEVAVGMVAGLQQLHGFETDLSHLALQGRCAVCAQI